MRTNIEVENRVMQDIVRLEESKNKNEIVTEALEALLKYLRRQDMLSLRGKIKWEGDLEQMRTD